MTSVRNPMRHHGKGGPRVRPRLVLTGERRHSMRPHRLGWALLAWLGGALIAGELVSWTAIVLKADALTFDRLALPLLTNFTPLAAGLGLVAAAIVALDHLRIARAAALVIALVGAGVLVLTALVLAAELLGDGMDPAGRDIDNLTIGARAGALALFLVAAAIAMWRHAGEETPQA